MIKLLSHQKERLNSIMRVSLITIVLSSFFITVGYAHGVTAKELSDRSATLDVKGNPPAAEEKTAVPQGIVVSGTITDETGMPVPGVNVLEKILYRGRRLVGVEFEFYRTVVCRKPHLRVFFTGSICGRIEGHDYAC